MTIIQTVIASINTTAPVTPPPAIVDPGWVDLNPYNGIRNSGCVRRDYNQGYFNDNLSFFTGLTPSATSNPGVVDIYNELNDAGIDNYSIEWTGYFIPLSGADYIFRTTSDDASYFWIGTAAIMPTIDNVNVNNGGAHGDNTVNGTTVSLSPGLYYPFRVMYGEAAGGATMRLEYSTDGGNNWNAMNNMVFINNTADGFLPLVTNGLTYHIDIGNTSSYPGTGSAVYDLASTHTGLNYGYAGGSNNGYWFDWAGLETNWTDYILTVNQSGSTIFTTTVTQMRNDMGLANAFQTADALPSYNASYTVTMTPPTAMTLYNTPTYVSNGASSYLTFDGDTQYAFTPNLVNKFNNTSNTNVALEVWVRSTSDEGCILVEEGTGSIDGGWYFSAMEIYNTYAWGRLWETGNVNFGVFPRSQWNHLVLTYDGATISGYLNGIQITSFPSSRDVPWHHGYGYYIALMANTATNMGGGQPGAGSKLAGDLAQFRIYNRAINASEVAHNYSATKARYGL